MTAHNPSVADCGRSQTAPTAIGNAFLLALLLFLFLPAPAHAQRERIRLKGGATNVSETQAEDVTLTLTVVARRQIQQIVRAAGAIDASRKRITATIASPEGDLIVADQRVRSFPPQSKSSMYQARVTRVTRQPGRTIVEATLSGEGVENRNNYVMEITVDRGIFLSVPNEAIIEEGDRRVVYIQKEAGHYLPQEIQTGLQGELFTEIQGGLKEGDQVVTFGSFFIDSEYKLKLSDQGPAGR